MYKNVIIKSPGNKTNSAFNADKFGIKVKDVNDKIENDITINVVDTRKESTLPKQRYKAWSCFRTETKIEKKREALWYISFKPLYGSIRLEFESENFSTFFRK